MLNNSVMAAFLLTGIGITCGTFSTAARADGVALDAKLDSIVTPYVIKHKFRGTVLVIDNGKVLLRKGYGFAVEGWNIPNSPSTRFEIASLTKQFTGAAILQLAQAGKLNISDPVSKYYPQAPASWRGISILNLVTHTSGLPNNAIKDFTKGITVPYSMDELIATFRDRPLAFKPGTNWAYTNTEYYLLAYIIEKVSGEKYGDYLRKHVFGPAGMKDSGYAETSEIVPHEAEGYSVGNGVLRHRAYFDRSLELGAGGIYATVDDLERWNQALDHNTLMSAASKEKMFREYPPGNYGFGWFIDNKSPRRAYHEGSDPGFAAFEIRFLDQPSVIVVLSNQEDAPVREIAKSIEFTLYPKLKTQNNQHRQ